jgi:protein-tyrosine phosphatase
MAEALLKQTLPDALILSAGIHALSGCPADPLAIQVMQEQGIDISPHRARGVTPQMINAADLILTMDDSQKKHIERKYVTSRGKVMRLGEFRNFDIADPYGKGLGDFQTAYTLIREGVEHLSEKITHLV